MSEFIKHQIMLQRHQMRESLPEGISHHKDFCTIHFWRYPNKREASIGSKCVPLVDLSRVPPETMKKEHTGDIS
jgi:hypothetical protein